MLVAARFIATNALRYLELSLRAILLRRESVFDFHVRERRSLRICSICIYTSSQRDTEYSIIYRTKSIRSARVSCLTYLSIVQI